MSNPKVSVAIITYNHEKYLVEAIESVLAQKTNFDFEIVIGEDCSKDNTLNICLEYQKKYPDKIKVLASENNTDRHKNIRRTYKACQGDYIAQLDGDDFWTNPHKLQKQIDFLDKHPDFAICFHNVYVKFEENTSNQCAYDFGLYSPTRWSSRLLNSKKGPYPLTKDVLTMDDLVVQGTFVATSSAVFRNHMIRLPKWFDQVYSDDYALFLLLAEHGKLKFIDEVMSVYRVHPENVACVMQGTLAKHRMLVHQNKLFMKHFDPKYRRVFKNRVEKFNKVLAKTIRKNEENINLFKKLKNKIERKRSSKNLFWRSLVFGKDSIWVLTPGFIKSKIEKHRNSKNLFWRSLVFGKDFIWGLTDQDTRVVWKRRIRKFFEREPSNFKYTLAVCTYFKDDAPYLKEWIEFHRLVGVEKFFLYNHNSSDNYMQVLKPCIDKGIVDLVDMSDWKSFPPSKKAHMDCIIKQEYNVKWIAFINIDEFLFSPIVDDLREILVEYENFPGVGVNWQMFGSSGHIKKPKGILIEAYTKKAKEDYYLNYHIKSIVNPRKVLSYINGHCFTYTKGFCVNENKKKVGFKIPNFVKNERYPPSKKYIDGLDSQIFSYPVSVSKLRINHYVTRSREECSSKMLQRSKFSDVCKKKSIVSDFNEYWKKYNKNDVEDTTILRFASKLKSNMRKTLLKV